MSNSVQHDKIEAAAFRRLVSHLQSHPEVQNIDLMILADFCRNCLADWYKEAAEQEGLDLTREDARERIYGMPYSEWKAAQPEATPEQLAAFKARKQK
ncbi:MAG: deoxycytidine triphosphate deaminase [Ponticaulis sp.]|nr:deoxycytidine triphosphate deaminase [Ponticaulis sp.]